MIHYEDHEPFLRFIVFVFDEYYPCGGMGDVSLETDDIDEAISFAIKNEPLRDAVYLLDRIEGRYVDLDKYKQ